MKRLILLIPLLFACDSGPTSPDSARRPAVILEPVQTVYVQISPDSLRTIAASRDTAKATEVYGILEATDAPGNAQITVMVQIIE